MFSSLTYTTKLYHTVLYLTTTKTSILSFTKLIKFGGMGVAGEGILTSVQQNLYQETLT